MTTGKCNDRSPDGPFTAPAVILAGERAGWKPAVPGDRPAHRLTGSHLDLVEPDRQPSLQPFRTERSRTKPKGLSCFPSGSVFLAIGFLFMLLETVKLRAHETRPTRRSESRKRSVPGRVHSVLKSSGFAKANSASNP